MDCGSSQSLMPSAIEHQFGFRECFEHRRARIEGVVYHRLQGLASERGILTASMDEFLAHCRGPVESHGQFTLDPRRYRETAIELDHRCPYRYLVKLFQCAFAACPEVLDVAIDKGRLELHFEPGPLANPERAQRHLQDALWLMQARYDLVLTVRRDAQEFSWAEGETRTREIPAQTRWLLRLQPGKGGRERQIFSPLQLLSPRVSKQWPEWYVMLPYLAAPWGRVRVNRKALRPHRDPFERISPLLQQARSFETVSACGWAGVGLLPREIAGGRVQPDTPVWYQGDDTARQPRCFFRRSHGSGVGANVYPRRWYVVQDGFIVDALPIPPHVTPFEGWLDGSELTTDASFLRAVRDDKWGELKDFAWHAAGEFTAWLCPEKTSP